MADWKVRRQDGEYPARDADTLREWARAGRIAPSDYVFNPILERWMYATEVQELSGLFRAAPSRKGPIVLGAILFLALLGAIGTYEEATKRSAPPSDPNALSKLDNFIVTQTGRHLYNSYEIQGEWVVVHINPSLWNSMSHDQQRQLCDILGKGTFLKAMNLSGAQLMVNETLIGMVVRAGGMQRFSPELDSLK